MILRPGTFLQDRYELIERIGSGGMSDVYKARCHKLNRQVAIKVLKEEFGEDISFVDKFNMEAESAAGLSHPNIVNVYDVVEEGALHYIVMEMVDGITLKNYIANKGCLDVKESIGIAIQVAQGISAAHERGIIHRDIKPQNIIISKDGKVKVADFGIARAISAQTLTSGAMGSVHYISPEQAKGALSDTRSDIYSLGITMYEMLTGRVPFDGDNTVAVALAHLEKTMPYPKDLNPDIPNYLEAVILKCTQKRPERRYQDIKDLIADLRKVLLNPDFDSDMSENDMGDTKVINVSQVNSYNERNKRVANDLEEDYADNDTEEDTRIDKIVSIIGGAVAVLIVLAIVFFVGKKIGIFDIKKNEVINTESAEALDGTQVEIPDVIGLNEEDAQRVLKEKDITMKVKKSEYSDSIPKGYIISQNPDAKSIVSKYSSAEVVISLGSDKIDLVSMNIMGLNIEEARRVLEEKGLSVTISEEFSDTVEAQKLIRFNPQRPEKGSMVRLYVSKGKEQSMVIVPNITGLNESSALALLNSSNLGVGTVKSEYSNQVEKGYIINQDISANTQVIPSSLVGYTVSLGVEDTKKYKYVASIDTTYNISDLIGPASSTTSVRIMVRLKQVVNGQVVYSTLMEPREVTGDTILPVRFKNIEGAYGVDQGDVEVVEVDSQSMLKAYKVEFFKVE